MECILTYEEMMMQISVGSLDLTTLAAIMQNTTDIRILKFGMCRAAYPYTVANNACCSFELFVYFCLKYVPWKIQQCPQNFILKTPASDIFSW